jgi:type VI secretion system secreted protein VgrG
MLIASTGADVSVSAKQHILATAQGAYLKLEGGNIELHAPGNVVFRAAMKNWTGPRAVAIDFMKFPQGDFCLDCWIRASQAQYGLVKV